MLTTLLIGCNQAEPQGEAGNGIQSIIKVESIGNVEYTDQISTIFTVTNDVDGAQGIQGIKGEDGHTPVIEIGDNGNWYIDGSTLQ